MLKVSNLEVSVQENKILKGVDLEVKSGEIHVIMGPNGSGKSTLAQVIAGHPNYVINKGQITFNKKDIKKLTPDKRAKLGIFLGFQHPVEISGVSTFNFLRRAIGSKQGSISQFRENIFDHASTLKLSEDFLRRSLNEGFSGGEKKRNEVLQLLTIRPKLAILDEIDSGLDVDGLRIVAGAIKKFRAQDSKSALILITHYARILRYLKADFVHIMANGQIVKTDKQKLANEIEEKGYQGFVNS